MQEETVDFKMDVSDERIKREAMRVIWMDSGVTFVDIKEKGILKVKGIFNKMELGSKLHELDDSVDIINQPGKQGQSYIPGFSTVYNYLSTPKVQDVLVFKFKDLDENMKCEAMEVIWEFSGVTSVEVMGDDELEVTGVEFNKIAMASILKDIDEYVSFIIKAGPDVKPPNNGASYGTNFKISNPLSGFRMPARTPAPAPVRAPPPAPVYARGQNFNHDVAKPHQRPILNVVAGHVRDFVFKPNANKFEHHAENYWGKKKEPQKEKYVPEIPKPQSASTSKSGTSKTEGETRSTWDPSSLVTGLSTMNPFQTKIPTSQMASSQTTRYQPSTQKEYKYTKQ